MSSGIIYYRLKSEYPNDSTKNCGLTGVEVDSNFYTLEGRDIKAIAVSDNTITVTLLNGDTLEAKIDLGSIGETVEQSIIKAEFDDVDGILTLTAADGTQQTISGFATTKNDSLSVATDNSIIGEGLKGIPLGVSPMAKTGQYRPVKSVIKVTDGESLPSDALEGDRYITKEQVSDYGYLYNYAAICQIASELSNANGGWRIPTKADWDDMLDSVERCDCDRTHTKCDNSQYLGKNAGKFLKSVDLWRNCNDNNDCCNCNCNNSDDSVSCIDYSDSCNTSTCCDSCNKCLSTDGHQGLDLYGFRVTPAGYGDDGGNFSYFKERAAFWTATNTCKCSSAYVKRFEYNKDSVYQTVYGSTYKLSLRLVKDYDGTNFKSEEEILDNSYKCVLMPSKKNGRSIWTAVNFACGNEALNPALPNDGQGITFTTHYYINEWNGFEWLRNEVKEGESVVIKNSKNDEKYLEYRVIDGELVCVNTQIYDSVMKNITEVVQQDTKELSDKIDAVETELNDKITTLENRCDSIDAQIQTEVATRETEDQKIYEALAKEVATRETEDQTISANLEKETSDRVSVDKEQWDAINAEITTRANEDQKIYAAITSEVETRESEDQKISKNLETEVNSRIEVDNQQWEVINTEIQDRKDADSELSDALAKEAKERTEADETLSTSLATETEERKTADSDLQTAIDDEIARAKAAEEEISGDLLASEGTEYNKETGVLTLKSADGTNDINVQFSFNFGTF